MRFPAALLLLTALPLLAGSGLLPPDPDKLSEGQRERASELFKQLQETADDPARRTEIIQEMAGIGRPVAQKMFDILDRQWGSKWDAYRGAYSIASRKAATVKTNAEAQREITELQSKVRGLRSRGGGLTKDAIKTIGDPALKRLRELQTLTIPEVLAADPKLKGLREEILAIAIQRDHCIEELVLTPGEARLFGAVDVRAFEQDRASAALGQPAEHIAILKQNIRTASASMVPSAEAAGVADMNRYRMLIGLAPCLLDSRLCEAARMHSKDMAERNFFSHDSPVPGRETPWKRAQLAGTVANAENIYSGANDGTKANKAWWYSPGHHVNMLNPGARRAGMGHHATRWTQLMGN